MKPINRLEALRQHQREMAGAEEAPPAAAGRGHRRAGHPRQVANPADVAGVPDQADHRSPALAVLNPAGIAQASDQIDHGSNDRTAWRCNLAQDQRPSLATIFRQKKHINPEIQTHHLHRTAQARLDEIALAAWAADHAGTTWAVSHLLQRIKTVLSAIDPKLQNVDIFGSGVLLADGTRQPRYTITGDISHVSIDEALADGNLREQMTLSYNAMRQVSKSLWSAATRARTEPAYDALLRNTTGIHVDLLLQCRSELEKHGEVDILAPHPNSVFAEAPAMRLERTPRVSKSTESTPRSSKHTPVPVWRTAKRVGQPMVPPLSDREVAHMARFLSEESGVAVSPSKARQQTAHMRLPTYDGKNRWSIDPEHPWVRQSIVLGHNVATGISTTVHRYMMMWKLLGCDAERTSLLRLACVGYLVPDHHSLHEVMSAAAEHGCFYDPLALASQLKNDLPALPTAASPSVSTYL